MVKLYKAIIRFVRPYTRYLLVFVILLIAFLYGKNLNIIRKDEALLTQIRNLEQRQQGIYEITSSLKSIEIPFIVPTIKGQGYRLNLDLETNNEDSVVTNVDSDATPGKIRLNFYLVSKYSDKTLILSDEFNDREIINEYEIKFVSDADYGYLLVEKENLDKNELVLVKNVHLTHLNVTQSSELNNLKPSIVGLTKTDRVVYSNLTDDVTDSYPFLRKNQSIGQVFTATEDQISAADFKIEFVGQGGVGNYFLELREVNEENGRVSSLGDRVAYYFFNYDEAQLLAFGDELYRFPLGAKLKKGQKYFIGFNNEQVGFTLTQTLKIYKSPIKTGLNDYGLSTVSGNFQKINNLAVKIYGADYSNYNGEKLISGVFIQDLGQGEGLYTYENRHDPSDFLDIYQVQPDNSSPGLVWYDNVQQGISARPTEGIEFIYKFNTVYPFRRLRMVFMPYGSGFKDSLYYYSLDNQNWQLIDNNIRINNEVKTKEKVDQVVMGEDNSNQVYLKVIPDFRDNTNVLNIFGIKNLEVNAELIIKK